MQPGESGVRDLAEPRSVSPGYFEAMGIPLLEARLFDERDDASAPDVVIVDERLAGKFWPAGDPIGKRMFAPNSADDLVSSGPTATWYVVGVVGPSGSSNIRASRSGSVFKSPRRPSSP